MATTDTNNLLLNEVPAATLSTLGFVYDSSNKFDVLLAHVFATDYNQSLVFAGRISSLPYWIERAGPTKSDKENSLRTGFYEYLNKFYQDVGIEIQVTEMENSSSRLDFRLIISVTENLKQEQYGFLVRTVRKKLEEIIRLNNYGE